MSGPLLGDAIHRYDAETWLSRKTARQLRELADAVENRRVGDALGYDSENAASFLRARASEIERTLDAWQENAEDEDVNAFLKAVQWTVTGDYGPDRVADAWDELAEGGGQ